jgi:L-asparaginase II
VTNPVLVEVLRGEQVESRHRGAVAVVEANGRVVVEIGDTAQPVFPRSAVKAIQALPLIESGAANAYGFGDRELALSCASHNGEPEHVAIAKAMLAKASLDETALECGSHWPSSHEATLALARMGKSPNQLHNNCSGKHSGFLCTCVRSNMDTRNYTNFRHPIQKLIREVMQEVTGAAHEAENSATDGCSIPTYAVPISALALGFAKMATGVGLGWQRAAAAKRLLAACMAEPFLVAGTGSADTRLMKLAPGRIFVKVGAEGVYCAAVPPLGLGIALKCDDGAIRAAEVMIAATLARIFKADNLLNWELSEQARPAINSRKGKAVGSMRPTAVLTG